MNFSKLKDAANKLLEFMEKYDLNNYDMGRIKKQKKICRRRFYRT